MTTATQLLDVARSTLGTREIPMGSNNTPYTRWAGMVGQPWCDLWVSWCFDRFPDLRVSERRHAYTPTHYAAFKARGRAFSDVGQAQPGDCLFFDFPGAPYRISHIGFVEKNLGGGRLVTVEGNTSDRVMRHVRAGSIVGFGRPAYTTTEDDDVELAELQRELVHANERQKAMLAAVQTDLEVAIGRVEEDVERTRRIVRLLGAACGQLTEQQMDDAADG